MWGGGGSSKTGLAVACDPAHHDQPCAYVVGSAHNVVPKIRELSIRHLMLPPRLSADLSEAPSHTTASPRLRRNVKRLSNGRGDMVYTSVP